MHLKVLGRSHSYSNSSEDTDVLVFANLTKISVSPSAHGLNVGDVKLEANDMILGAMIL